MKRDQVTDLVPFAHVADVSRSVAFYELLGFRETERYERRGEVLWTALANGHARLMVTKSEEPIDPAAQKVLFYLYARDLDGLRERLLASGVGAGPIVDGSPGPEREMKVVDPDGWRLMIAETADDALWLEPPG